MRVDASVLALSDFSLSLSLCRNAYSVEAQHGSFHGVLHLTFPSSLTLLCRQGQQQQHGKFLSARQKCLQVSLSSRTRSLSRLPPQWRCKEEETEILVQRASLCRFDRRLCFCVTYSLNFVVTMKPYVPGFLRKKLRSSSSLSSSSKSLMKSSDSLQPSMSLDSSSSPSFFSAGTSSPASGGALSSEGRWSKDVLQAQQVSSSKEIVVLEEITGKVKNQFASNMPSCSTDRELEEAFLRFDANRDGKISALELGSVLRSLGDNPSDEELLLMVKEVDRDGDGFIDLQEFILLNRACSSSGKEDLRQAFLVFDADADGKISVEELHHVLSRLGELCTLEECSRMIRGVDMDGDGFVDFQEFCTMMRMQS